MRSFILGVAVGAAIAFPLGWEAAPRSVERHPLEIVKEWTVKTHLGKLLSVEPEEGGWLYVLQDGSTAWAENRLNPSLAGDDLMIVTKRYRSANGHEFQRISVQPAGEEKPGPGPGKTIEDKDPSEKTFPDPFS